MASLAVPFVATLALAVPLLALREVLEKRSRRNFKRHLGRRVISKVSFDMDGKEAIPRFVTCQTVKQAPLPTYDELYRPPPPYKKN